MKKHSNEKLNSSPAPSFRAGHDAEDDMIWKVLSAVAKHAITQHDYAAAQKYYHQSLVAAAEAFGADDLRVGLVLLDSADLYCLQKDYKQARLVQHRLKRILESYAHQHESNDYSHKIEKKSLAH